MARNCHAVVIMFVMSTFDFCLLTEMLRKSIYSWTLTHEHTCIYIYTTTSIEHLNCKPRWFSSTNVFVIFSCGVGPNSWTPSYFFRPSNTARSAVISQSFHLIQYLWANQHRDYNIDLYLIGGGNFRWSKLFSI